MAERARILVADDEVNLRRVLSALLAREGFEVVQAGDGAEAIATLERGERMSAVITDLRMPRVDGIGVLKWVAAHRPELPVIILTAHGTVDTAVEALKGGAFDFITKPFEQVEMRQVVHKAVRTYELGRGEVGPTPALPLPATPAATSSTPAPAGPPGTAVAAMTASAPAAAVPVPVAVLPPLLSGPAAAALVGQSAAMRAIHGVIAKVARTPSTVLIMGESGTGKELVAKALHEFSARAGKPFIKIHAAAIPRTLIESELFGYEKGAFTGAVTSKPGRFELAHEGTLFLDEIGEVPPEVQVKLLRVLQEHEFERVGGLKTLKVDARLVAATNRDLVHEIAAGTFREDLYYRLNVVRMVLPPLRDRREDIPLLVEHFLHRFNARLHKRVARLDDEATACLQAHGWPGNIRELENVIERTVLFCEQEVATCEDLPDELVAGHVPAGTPRPVPQVAAAAPAAALDETGDAAEGVEVIPGTTPLKELVREAADKVERDLIVRALNETGGNVTRAARRLQISRKSLQTKMKEFGLRESPAEPGKPGSGPEGC